MNESESNPWQIGTIISMLLLGANDKATLITGAEYATLNFSWASMQAFAVVMEANTSRECHGYAKTRGFEVTGFTGTGTVP